MREEYVLVYNFKGDLFTIEGFYNKNHAILEKLDIEKRLKVKVEIKPII